MKKKDMMIRKAENRDLDDILEVFRCAREFMRRTGNPNQWKEGYPGEDLVRCETETGKLNIIERDGRICGVFALISGIDETYLEIKGRWLNDEPYVTIHRIAAAPGEKDILKTALFYAESKADNVRIDTHEDNSVMRHLLEKFGYIECGIIRIADGSPRVAYQKKVR